MIGDKSLLSIAPYDNELSNEEQENLSDILTEPSIFTQSGKSKNSVPLTTWPELNVPSISTPQSLAHSQSLTQIQTHNVNNPKSLASVCLPGILLQIQWLLYSISIPLYLVLLLFRQVTRMTAVHV